MCVRLSVYCGVNAEMDPVGFRHQGFLNSDTFKNKGSSLSNFVWNSELFFTVVELILFLSCSILLPVLATVEM